MRGVHRGSTVHRVAKKINPRKIVLFGITLIALCNICPWSFLEGRLNKGWKDISSLEDALGYAKQYTGKAKVNTFETLRKLTQKYIGLDVYFIVFNFLRLIIAMVLKDLICLAIPFTQPKKKPLGRKLIHTMRSQVHPDAEESDDELVFEPVEQTNQDLGPIGGVTTVIVKNTVKLVFSVFRAILRKIRMYTMFVWYIFLMVAMFGKMLLSIPRAIFTGFGKGVEDSGIVAAVKNVCARSGLRQIMWDNLAEMFNDSDTEDDDDDQPGVTGFPTNRETNYFDSSDDELDPTTQKNIEAGLIDSTQLLATQLNISSRNVSNY